jgi:hypothetical protein
MDRLRPYWVYHTTDKEPEQADAIPELAEKPGSDLNELENLFEEFNAAPQREWV